MSAEEIKVLCPECGSDADLEYSEWTYFCMKCKRYVQEEDSYLAQLLAARKSIQEKDIELDAVKFERKRLADALACDGEEIERLRRELDAARAEIEKLQTELQVVLLDSREKAAEIEKLKAEFQSVWKSLDKTGAENQKLKAERLKPIDEALEYYDDGDPRWTACVVEALRQIRAKWEKL